MRLFLRNKGCGVTRSGVSASTLGSMVNVLKKIKGDRMSRCFFALILGMFVLIVLGAVLFPLYCMVGVFPSRNLVRVSESVTAAQLDGSASIQSTSYRDAVKDIREDLAAWMTLIGVFGAFFGLIVPAGSYLLQRQSIKEESRNFTKKIEELENCLANEMVKHEDARIQLSKFQQDYENKTQKILEYANLSKGLVLPYWVALARLFERAVFRDSMALAENLKRSNADCFISDCADVQLGLEHCFDAYVCASRGSDIKRVAGQFKKRIDEIKLANENVWHEATMLNLRNKKQLARLTRWKQYEEVLANQQETLKWICGLYSEFAPIKLKDVQSN